MYIKPYIMYIISRKSYHTTGQKLFFTQICCVLHTACLLVLVCASCEEERVYRRECHFTIKDSVHCSGREGLRLF